MHLTYHSFERGWFAAADICNSYLASSISTVSGRDSLWDLDLGISIFSMDTDGDFGCFYSIYTQNTGNFHVITISLPGGHRSVGAICTVKFSNLQPHRTAPLAPPDHLHPHHHPTNHRLHTETQPIADLISLHGRGKGQ